MAGKDWEINTTTGDLTVSGGDYVFVEEALRVAQAVETTLRSFQGEWFLNTAFGVPYFQNVLGKRMVDKSVFDSIVKAAVIGVEDVNTINAYSSEFIRQSRTYEVNLTADTTFGPITVKGVLP
jgi:hypothetical protein